MARLKDGSLRCSLKLLLVLFLLVSCGRGQKFTLGTCPTVTPVTGFSTLLLPGTWFEYGRTPSVNEHSLRCVTFTFTADATNTMFGITLSAVKTFLSNTVTAFGSATFPAVTTPTMRVRFPTPLSAIGGTTTTTYMIIATDGVGTAAAVTTPATFFVLYSCRNVGLGRKVNIIFLTSTATPTQATINLMNQAIANLNVPTSWVKVTEQDTC